MRRDIQRIDDDIVRKKLIIEQALYSDPDIVEVIDDKDIDPSCPEDLVYSSIYPFIRIPDTQDKSKSYITFSVSDMGLSPRNEVMKNQYVQFVIFVHKDLAKTNYGMARHDCLGYLVRDVFNLSNMLGPQMTLVSNVEGVTDTDYLTRTLKFELVDNNSTKPLRTNSYEYDRIVGHRR
jgi:hypothetical protein